MRGRLLEVSKYLFEDRHMWTKIYDSEYCATHCKRRLITFECVLLKTC